MKRWQDRGEVLDSDDDQDLDLDGEDELKRKSPVRKRARLGGRTCAGSQSEGKKTRSGAEDEGDVAEEGWLQPKVANTYGKKSRVTKLAAQQGLHVDFPEASREANINSLHKDTSFRSPQSEIVSDVENRKNSDLSEAAANGDEQNAELCISADASALSPNHGPRSTAKQPDPDPKRLSEAQPPSSGSECLPDIRDFLARREPAFALERPMSKGTMCSGLSSPLSERSVSPEPPTPTFHFPSLAFDTEPTPAADVPINTRDHGDSSIAPSRTNNAARSSARPSTAIEDRNGPSIRPGEFFEDAHPGRRTFRARNAQQLHPYEYERLQYQKQFRERGLRTVKVTEPERRTAEQQDGSSSDEDQNSWQPSQQPVPSSPARPSSEIGNTLNLLSRDDSDHEFPDLAFSNRRTAVAVIPRGPKRQKLSHRRMISGGHAAAGSQPSGEFSIPPSPPPTSSESNDNGGVTSHPAMFRFPRGMTPNARAQQPTPNVSSDLRPVQNESEEDIARRSRLSTVSRFRHAPMPVDSSSESSQPESDVNHDPDIRRLLKERKRIRGVLPASWLKFDFKAQQRRSSRSPEKRVTAGPASPEQVGPRKGVAQRVPSRGVALSTQRPQIPVPDDDESDNDLSTYLSPLKKRQTRLQFDRGASSVEPADFVDEDRMEVDYVDAMLAGSSRPKNRADPAKKRQPRITDALNAGHNDGDHFVEEKRAARRAGGTSHEPRRKCRLRVRRQAPGKPSAPLLSIVDAPASPSEAIPLFIKLARRRARRREDNGRHSPSRKHIRLATQVDTEDAASVLRKWREGTIAPRQGSLIPGSHRRLDGGTPDEHVAGLPAASRQRLPLAETSENQQGRNPTASRTTTAAWKQRVGAKRLSAPRLKMRQSRLQPVTLDEEASSEQPGSAHYRDHIADDEERPSQPVRPRPHPSQTRYRGAQLESLESDFDSCHRSAAFERRMQMLTESVVRRRGGSTPAAPVQLERYLHSSTHPNTRGKIEHDMLQHSQRDKTNKEQTHHPRRLERRPRKGIPRHLDAEARQYRQPSEPLPDVVCVSNESVGTGHVSVDGPVLQGLGPFGTRYAVDFDTLPLPLGTYFHESSFIGSGDFAASLDFADRNLDVSTGRIRIHVDMDILDLGVWNEEVAVGLARIPQAISHALSSLVKIEETQGSQTSPEVVLATVDYLLRSTVRYFTRCLAFSDPVDRCMCVRSLLQIIGDTIEVATEPGLSNGPHKDIVSRCLQYTVALARQAVQLCHHPMVPSELAPSGELLFERATNLLANQIVESHLTELRCFYEDIRRAAKREAGIRDTDAAICSITVLYHVLKGLDRTSHSFWSTLYRAMNVRTEKIMSVSALDRAWCNLFTVLPALEIDSRGLLRLGSRFQDGNEDWSLCRALLDRLLQLYPGTSLLPGSTINDYVRATLIRCSRLQDRWAWQRCETMLYSISDFFARRGLAPLHKERSHGSPAFLQELDLQPSLDVQPDEKSFQIFLKMLASGLRGMRDRSIYSDKRIGGIAWRFIPNHGRTYRKDADVRQEDLDALRNHHDLLCTVYYASPPSNRLRVDLIQNLVDPTTSHREACRLNVRAWRNLAAFQASTGEAIERLAPFNDWFRELLTANVAQFRVAKAEVEQDAASAVASGKPEASQDLIDSIIVANQRQIAATILDALAAVKFALSAAASLHAVSALVEGTAFWQVFDLFDPAARRFFGMFDEALEAVKRAIEMQKKFLSEDGSQVRSDDSQDYGDSTALLELASTQMPSSSFEPNVLDIVHAHTADFVSSVFGAEGMPDDALLAKVIDVWVDLAGFAVSQGQKDWQNYISSYSSEAWSQLRDTEQRRKYTPYFLARVSSHQNVELMEAGILMFWLKSLVEREATLKFQHTFTNALLNRGHREPLLVNLPFVRPCSGHFALSLHELRQSRLGLLSSVLSNMHQHLNETMHRRPAEFQENRRSYSDMLRQMMQAMKANYLEIQGRVQDDFANPQAQGDYVSFVQQVVSFLQQYTVDICPIDRFFTDSAAFPLPEADPTYVVGRLKGYVSKLSAGNKRKELAVFVQAVSERAAVDGKQGYLVDQLSAAMIGVLERGDPRAPSLRHVLMTAVLPVYVNNALSTACSWVLALPLLQVCGRVLPDLVYSVMMEDEQSLQAALHTIAIPMRSMLRVVQSVLTYPGQLMFTHVLSTLTTIFETVRRSLTIAHHLATASKNRSLAQAANDFDQRALAIRDHLTGDEFVDLASTHLDELPAQSHWQDTRDFSTKQYEENMRGWHAREGQYFMRRGSSHVEVVVHLGDLEEEKLRLLEALQWYQQSYGVVFKKQRMEDAMLSADEVVV